VSKLRDWLCYVIVTRWPFGFGQYEPGKPFGTWRRIIYFALLPYAGSHAYRNDEL